MYDATNLIRATLMQSRTFPTCIALRGRRLAELDPDGYPCDGKSTSSLRASATLSGLGLLDRTDSFVCGEVWSSKGLVPT